MSGRPDITFKRFEDAIEWALNKGYQVYWDMGLNAWAIDRSPRRGKLIEAMAAAADANLHDDFENYAKACEETYKDDEH